MSLKSSLNKLKSKKIKTPHSTTHRKHLSTIEEDFPIEEVLGETTLQKTTYKLLNPFKAQTLTLLADSLPAVESPEDLEGSNKLRQAGELWDTNRRDHKDRHSLLS
jgi:hypothetical protein